MKSLSPTETAYSVLKGRKLIPIPLTLSSFWNTLLYSVCLGFLLLGLLKSSFCSMYPTENSLIKVLDELFLAKVYNQCSLHFLLHLSAASDTISNTSLLFGVLSFSLVSVTPTSKSFFQPVIWWTYFILPLHSIFHWQSDRAPSLLSQQFIYG